MSGLFGANLNEDEVTSVGPERGFDFRFNGRSRQLRCAHLGRAIPLGRTAPRNSAKSHLI